MVWIEICCGVAVLYLPLSPPARVVWIEIVGSTNNVDIYPSPPARVVWIEIRISARVSNARKVATREGGVD